MSPSRRVQQHSTGFPARQMFVLALCRIGEPIAFMSIFPYVYYMVSSFNVAEDDKQIAIYAGFVTSAFALCEAMSGIAWGCLSDKIGRKPILLTGLAGTGISMVVFGFSPNFTTALIARALGGLLNGNIGVIQTTVTETVTEKEHEHRAYSIMPVVWCVGSIVGAALGGLLADPVRNHPGWFEHGSLFSRYPYLLPNLVCAGVVVLGMIVGILFLEETHEDKKTRRDLGLEIGDWILEFFRSPRTMEKQGETLGLFDGEAPPGYSSTETSPSLGPFLIGDLPGQIQDQSRQPVRTKRRGSGFLKAFTRQVNLNILSYGILACHTISAEQLLSVLFSLPESEESPKLPFQFSGGFAMSTTTIGYILIGQGILQIGATFVVFPFVNRRIGSLATFQLAVLSYPLLYLLVPYLALAPSALRMPCTFLILIWKVTAQAFSFPALSIMLANAAPSKKVLGTLNGVSASSASACRALGPPLLGSMQSLGLSVGVIGLPWWANSLIAGGGAILSTHLVEEKKKYSKADEANVDSDNMSFLDADTLESAVANESRDHNNFLPAYEQHS